MENTTDAKLPASPPLPAPTGSADAELVRHMHAFMDELNWFHAHDVKLHLKPAPTGWNIKFSIPDSQNGKLRRAA
jgi:hypothetical protein